VPAGEGATPLARTGLVQHRRPLWRGFAEVDGVDPVLRPMMGDGPHPRGIGERPARRVAHHRVVRPAAFPQRVYRRHVLVGQVVAVVMGHLPGVAERPGGAVQVAGDDVPADPPVRQVVERAHPPREQGGRLVGEVTGDAEAEMPRDRSHRRHQQQRVEQRHLHAATQCRVGSAVVDVVQAEHVGEEQPVEQAAFQQAREPGPVLQAQVVGTGVARMGPHALLDVAGRRHVERVEPDFTGGVRLLRASATR